jgi:radical SAM protein with 4Fe4S-binding SPASM domain
LSLNVPWQRVQFQITGGEPFVRKDFFKFLEVLAKNALLYGYKWVIMCNGSFLTEETVVKLKKLNVNNIQVSLEGTKKLNDEIRGKGSFDKTIKAIKILKKNNISTSVSLTLTRKNMNNVFSLIKELDLLGVDILGIRRLVPWGRGSGLDKYLLSPQELKDFYLKVEKYKENLRKKGKKIILGTGCESAMFNQELLPKNKALGYNEPRSIFRGCGVASGSCLTIMTNGDVVPCRRFPIVLGNALKKSIYDIYFSRRMRDFRNPNKANAFCQDCPNFINCLGGAKCVTYAYYKKWDVPDAQCWRAYKDLGQPSQKLKKADINIHNKLT